MIGNPLQGKSATRPRVFAAADYWGMALTGLFVGLLVGLAVSPVVGTVVGLVLSAVLCISGSQIGGTSAIKNQPPDPHEHFGSGSGIRVVRPAHLLPFSSLAIVGMVAGVYVRTHGMLEDSAVIQRRLGQLSAAGIDTTRATDAVLDALPSLYAEPSAKGQLFGVQTSDESLLDPNRYESIESCLSAWLTSSIAPFRVLGERAKQAPFASDPAALRSWMRDAWKVVALTGRKEGK